MYLLCFFLLSPPALFVSSYNTSINCTSIIRKCSFVVAYCIVHSFNQFPKSNRRYLYKKFILNWLWRVMASTTPNNNNDKSKGFLFIAIGNETGVEFYLRKTLYFVYVYRSFYIALVLLSFVVVVFFFFFFLRSLSLFRIICLIGYGDFVCVFLLKKKKHQPEKRFGACTALCTYNIHRCIVSKEGKNDKN